MLGRFLEFSVRAPDILDSLAFYKALGFTELSIGEVWPHKYAVVSDGDLCIGLHEREIDSPALTFVHPDVARHARAMADHGFEFSYLKIDEDVFNQLGFADPDGHMITLLEARTFSPAVEEIARSLCGEWFETTLPVKNAMHTGRFWAPLAPVLLRLREEPTTHMRFDADGMALGLSESIALKQPSLCFKCHDRKALLATIDRHGTKTKPFPGFEGAFAELRAPEGTRLYLFDEDFLGETYIVEESGEYEAL
jgi:catechol 2,3-dioxygenase-like lactoylglutathione lyase family enzyme